MTKIGTLFLLAFLATTCSAQLLRSGLDPQLARRLNANTDLINRVIKLLLPVANTQLQALIKDPVDIPVEESFSAGKTQAAGDCQAGEDITATLVLGALSGQNSTEITSLTVREGTEEVSCGCCPTTFSGTFDIVLCKYSSKLL